MLGKKIILENTIKYGAYKLTLQELRLNDPHSFRQYLRTNTYIYEAAISIFKFL